MYHVNVVIAKRGRNSHLRTCLHYLSKAATCGRRFYSINVYVIDDGVEPLPDFLHSSGLNVHNIFHATNGSGKFNKSKLLNYGLSVMHQEYDWVSIIDIDMLYVNDTFDRICETFNDRNDVIIVSRGNQLSPIASAHYIATKGSLASYNSFTPLKGNSQVSMPKKMVESAAAIYGSIYCEDFEGWGGEDSDVTCKLSELRRAGIIKERIYLDNMWYHLYHEPTKTQENAECNKILLEQRRSINRDLFYQWRDHHDSNRSDL